MQCIYLRIKYCHLQAIISFIYTGLCKVAQENLQDFLEISKDLEIGGLANIQDIKVNKIASDVGLSQIDGEAAFHKKGNKLFGGPANIDSSVTKILNKVNPGHSIKVSYCLEERIMASLKTSVLGTLINSRFRRLASTMTTT